MARTRKRKDLIQQIAQERLDYNDLRPGQEAAIRSLLEGKDTLAVMPTGSGKSAIYQLAAEETPGATIIRSARFRKSSKRSATSTRAQSQSGAIAIRNDARLCRGQRLPPSILIKLLW